MNNELNKRIPEIDGLRGIAVIGVLIWHFTGSMIANDGSFPSAAVIRATVFGRTGVDLFFVLSGFLIIGILVDYRKAPGQLRVFYIRRFFRIWPPYLMLIALYWSCYAYFGESQGFNTRYGFWTQLVSQLTFNWNSLMSVYDNGIARGFSVVWSVNIEEWFYIIFPILIVTINPSRLHVFLIAAGIASAAARISYNLSYPTSWLPPYVLLPFRLDGLCTGGLIALAVRSPATVRWATSHRKYLMSIVILSTVTAVVAVIWSLNDLDRQMYLWGHLYLSITFGAVVFWATTIGNRYLRLQFLREIGRYSYTLYLVHPLFISAFFQMANRPERISSLQDAVTAALALIVSAAFAWLSYWTVEQRAVSWGHQSSYRSNHFGILSR